MIKRNLKYILYGLIIGASMLIPGLSGGTMGILLGIYDKLIEAVAKITTKDGFKNNAVFLICFCTGSLTGFYLFSKVVLIAIEAFEYPLMFLFIGMILGSLPTIMKKGQIKNIGLKDIIYIFIGFAICLAFILIPDNISLVSGTNNILGLIMIVFSGIIIAIALILPGLSVSQMLVLLGLYTVTLDAVANLKLGFLIPFALSVGAASLFTANILNKYLNKNPKQSYLLIAGFVLGSIFEMVPKGAKPDYPVAVISLTAGFLIIYFITHISRKIAN